MRWSYAALAIALLCFSVAFAADDAVAGPVVKLKEQQALSKDDNDAKKLGADILPPPPGNTSSSTTEDLAKCV